MVSEKDIEEIIVKGVKRSLDTEYRRQFYIYLPVYFPTHRKEYKIGPFGCVREAQRCRNKIVLNIRKKDANLLTKVDQTQTFAPTLYDLEAFINTKATK